MSEDHLDDLIKERFARLRAEENAGVPDFAAMYARAEQEPAASVETEHQSETQKVIPLAKRRKHWIQARWPVAVGTLAAAALAGVMLIRPGTADAEFEALVTAFAADNAAWQSPTDDLLNVPGLEFMNSVPVIGGPYGAPLDTPDTPRASGDVTG